MIKGCQKRMIFVKDTGSDLFEEAYFVLKSDIPANDDLEYDIVQSATAIINENNFSKKPRKKKKNLKNFWFFLVGCIVGIGVTLLFSIIF